MILISDATTRRAIEYIITEDFGERTVKDGFRNAPIFKDAKGRLLSGPGPPETG